MEIQNKFATDEGISNPTAKEWVCMKQFPHIMCDAAKRTSFFFIIIMMSVYICIDKTRNYLKARFTVLIPKFLLQFFPYVIHRTWCSKQDWCWSSMLLKEPVLLYCNTYGKFMWSLAAWKWGPWWWGPSMTVEPIN